MTDTTIIKQTFYYLNKIQAFVKNILSEDDANEPEKEIDGLLFILFFIATS